MRGGGNETGNRKSGREQMAARRFSMKDHQRKFVLINTIIGQDINSHAPRHGAHKNGAPHWRYND
jgi:hypothetical protein